MSKTSQTRHLISDSSETRLKLLETLPGALFLVDDATTIIYANASAQTLLGSTREDLLGKPLWRSASLLVSTELYQTVQKARQTQAPTEVEYVSSVTGTWLHVQLSPTASGLMIQFHQGRTAASCQETAPQGEHLHIDDLDGLYSEIIVLTPEGIVLEINEVPFMRAQIRREEVIGHPLVEAGWWSFYSTSQAQLHAAIARANGGEAVHFETVVHPREGIDHYLEVAITPHRDTDHHIAYLVLAGINITARKRAEAEIHALVDAIPQLVWTTQPDGSADSCNQRMCDYSGLSPEEAQEEGWMQCLHPEDLPREADAWQRAAQNGGVYETELRLRQGTTGEYRWFLARAMPVRDETGQIIKWFGTCTDINEQKRTEQRLKESQENWHALAETVPQLVWVIQSDGLPEYVNQRWCDYTGLTLEHVHSELWAYLQFIHPDDRESNRAHVQHTLDTGAVYEHKVRLKNGQTGEYRWFLSRAMPMRDEAGRIVKWFGTHTDIEDQVRIEEALRQSQERAHVLMNSSIIGIFVHEGEQIVDANETFLHMTGYTREDVHAGRMDWLHMTAPEDRAQTWQAHQELATQRVLMPHEKECMCKDGSRLPVLIGGVLFQHHPFQGIAFVLDNSARKELEQRKDAFISMASHELRNPLTVLKLQTTLLHRQLARHGILDQAPALASMETQIRTITRLVEELLDVSKIQAGKLEYVRETVNLDALLREITDILQQSHPNHPLAVRSTVGTSLIGDRDRLGQVFTNLITNAIKYSPDAEIVTIDLSTSDDVVTVSVRDHGLGIPRELRDKIFERFYRVADPKRKAISGLGMGLYIVAEIVKDHGGTITVDSEVGKGSTFTVTLPKRRDA